MNITITHQAIQQDVISILIENEAGLQIEITVSRIGFIVNPGVPVEVERWDGLAWEIVPAAPEGCGADE